MDRATRVTGTWAGGAGIGAWILLALAAVSVAGCCATGGAKLDGAVGDGAVVVEVQPLPDGAIDPAVLEPPSGDASADLVEFVRLGYGDLHGRGVRSLDFRTEGLTTEQAATVIRLVDSYNAFEGEKVAAGVETFRGRVSGWEFGREGSPVLYVDLPHWTHQREGSTESFGDGTRIPDAEHQQLVDDLRATFVDTLAADEFSPSSYSGDHTYRMWWD